MTEKYEEFAKISSDTKISNCHLIFAVTFQNNTDENFNFSAQSTIPVYTGREFILNAMPENRNNTNEFTIPARSRATIKFRGEIDNTTALKLLREIPDVRLHEGQINIYSPNIKYAVQTSLSVETVSIKCKEMHWRIRKFWNNKPVTIRQALDAINSIYRNAPFEFDKQGNLIALFGKNYADSKANTCDFFPVWRWGEHCIAGCLDSETMSRELPDNGIYFEVISTESAISHEDIAVQQAVFNKCADLCKQDNIFALINSCSFLIKYGHLTRAKEILERILTMKTSEKEKTIVEIARLLLVDLYFLEGNIAKAKEIFTPLENNDNPFCRFYQTIFLLSSEKKDEQKAGIEKLIAWEKANKNIDKSSPWYVGYQMCCFQLAQYYLNNGTEQDESRAFEYLKKAEGHWEADYILGHYWYMEIDLIASFKAFERVLQFFEQNPWVRKNEEAEKRYYGALAEITRYYLYGWGVEQNRNKAEEYLSKCDERGQKFMAAVMGEYYLLTGKRSLAFQWFELGEKNGDIESLAWLGYCYLYGIGTEKNMTKAMKLLDNEATAYSPRAQYFLALIKRSEGKHKEFRELLKAAAEGCCPEALAKYGVLLISAAPQNIEQGIMYLEKAMMFNIPLAASWYYACMSDGIGMPKNEKLAFDELIKLADVGEPFAQYFIALIYYSGTAGQKRDLSKAQIYAEKSVNAGGPPMALYVLGMIYSEMGKANDAQKCFEAAAKAGIKDAERFIKR